MTLFPKPTLILALLIFRSQADPTPPHALNFNKLRQEQLRPINSAAPLELLSQALANTAEPSIQISILQGMKTGLAGQSNLPAPLTWKEALAQLSKSTNSKVKNLTREISQIFGDQDAVRRSLSLLEDPTTPLELRRIALQSLLTQPPPEFRDLLATLLDDSALQIEAIRAYSLFHDKKAPDLLLSRFPKLSPEAQQQVIQTLATRKDYATGLLDALQNKTIAKAQIPAYLARSLTELLGAPFTKVYGDLQELSKDKEALFIRYKTLLTPENLAKADAARGRQVYQITCAACHRLYDSGGTIGPDLTGSNRGDLDYLLLNTIDPSADIAESYQLISLETKAGQLFSGTLAGEDDQKIVINSVGQTLTILKADLAKRHLSPLSMMPEGILPSLPDQQVLDLVKYLKTQKQVPLTK